MNEIFYMSIYALTMNSTTIDFCLVREGKREITYLKIRAEATIIITYNLVTRIVRVL